MNRYLLIYNPKAGGGRAAECLAAIVPRLRDGGVVAEVVATSGPGDATRIAAERAGTGPYIIAAGGDGTVVEVATGLLQAGQHPARLAILPLGTGNDTGGGLGIPDLERGVAAIVCGTWRSVDAIRVTCRVGDETVERLSLIGAGLGAPAEVLVHTTLRAKRLLGRYSYHYAALRTMLAYRAPQMHVVVDGLERAGRFLVAAAANLESTAGQTVRMAPGALCDDGRLDVLLIPDLPRHRRLGLLTRLAGGRHLELPGVELIRAADMTVNSEPAARLNIDGELFGTTPAEFRVLPAVAEIRVPPGWASAVVAELSASASA